MRVDVYIHQISDPNPKLDQILDMLKKEIALNTALDDQIAALAAAEADEHKAIGDAVQRVSDKLTALSSANPTLAAQIDAIKTDTATAVALAANATPPPTPVPEPAPAPGP